MLEAKLSMERSLVGVMVPNGTHMDAAVSGDLAAIEIQHAGIVNVTTPGANDYHAPHIISLSLSRGDAERLLTLLADKLRLPAFNEREWRRLAWAADRVGQVDDEPDLVTLAERIEEAYR